jgi:hypothetical protein
VLVPLGAVILYAVPPAENHLYPQCIFHLLTGLHCPGCGTTRCLHALLHGDLAQAAAYNILILIALALFGVWGLRRGSAVVTGRPLRSWRLPTWSMRLLLYALLAFWVLRNLDVTPFNFLAPHELGR